MVRNIIQTPLNSVVSDITLTLGNEVMLADHRNIKTNDISNSFIDYISSLSRYYEWYLCPQSGNLNHSIDKEEFRLEHFLTEWPKSVKEAVGSELVNVVIKDLLIEMRTAM